MKAQRISRGLLLMLVLFYLTLIIIGTGCVTEKRCNAKYPPQVETITNHTKEVAE